VRPAPLLLCLPFLLSFRSSRDDRDDTVSVLFAPTGERRALEAAIGAELRSASRSIDVAMFHFTSDRLVQALAERRRAGLAVRILLDRLQSDDDFVRRLQAEGLEVRRVTPRQPEARFHQKYAVLDAKIVVTGSYNWTVQGDIANHENVVILRHEAAARAFHEEFEKTWQDKELSPR
jgi:phosphatidylserine/phosphatidylglycerophosphate/cardiolipin synthase-like enzyme